VVLMGKAVMGLLPDMRSEQVIKRSNFPSPRQFCSDFQPLGVLVKHRIDDVNKCLIAIKQPVPSREQITLEPTFTLMLAQHLNDPAISCKKLIILFHPSFPLPISDFKNTIQPIGKRLVRTKDPEISLLFIELNHIAQKLSEHMRVRSID